MIVFCQSVDLNGQIALVNIDNHHLVSLVPDCNLIIANIERDERHVNALLTHLVATRIRHSAH